MNSDAIKVQHQIRQNALEMQDYLKDLGSWESQMKKRDGQVRKSRENRAAAPTSVPPVRSRLRASVVTTTSPGNSTKSSLPPQPKEEKSTGSAAKHTYDKGYKKWESFDVDAALADTDDEEEAPVGPSPAAADTAAVDAAGPVVTPATMLPTATRAVRQAMAAPAATAAVPVVSASVRAREEVERESGNEHFRQGRFAEAVKCYTRAIGLNPTVAVYHSNRAAALLRIGERERARDDCATALRRDPAHVKSWSRRASAHAGTGCHRAAVGDLRRALELQPTSKFLRSELRKALDKHKSAARKAPRRKLTVTVVDALEDIELFPADVTAASEVVDAPISRGGDAAEKRVRVPIDDGETAPRSSEAAEKRVRVPIDDGETAPRSSEAAEKRVRVPIDDGETAPRSSEAAEKRVRVPIDDGETAPRSSDAAEKRVRVLIDDDDETPQNAAALAPEGAQLPPASSTETETEATVAAPTAEAAIEDEPSVSDTQVAATVAASVPETVSIPVRTVSAGKVKLPKSGHELCRLLQTAPKAERRKLGKMLTAPRVAKLFREAPDAEQMHWVASAWTLTLTRKKAGAEDLSRVAAAVHALGKADRFGMVLAMAGDAERDAMAALARAGRAIADREGGACMGSVEVIERVFEL